jgi:cytochrome c-type biogenesis protein CcmE
MFADIVSNSPMAMTSKQRRRLSFALALVLAGAAAAVLVIFALQDNVLFFYSPSDLAAHPPAAGRTVRIGGLVQQGSVRHGSGLETDFAVTDGKHTVSVRYSGVLPDLFREGQGVVALGATQQGGTFVATEILAKHDERYMPREVVDALKRAGRWREGQTTPAPAPSTNP